MWTDLSSVLSQCTRVTDGRTDGQNSHRYTASALQFTTPFKDDIRQLADLKQQISQKMILLCSISPKCHCAQKQVTGPLPTPF